MTQYQVTMPLWDGQRWHQPGQPYPPEGVEADPKLIRRYHPKFIATLDEIAAQANPEAHGARTELQVAQARVAELEAQVAAQSTPPENSDVSALLAELAGEDGQPPALADAVEAVKALKQGAARAEQYAALTTVEGGTDLPSNFVGRGKFAALGLTTYESLRGKSAQQLDAVEGVTPEQAAKAAELVDAHFAKTE